jgi:hypothetical protein
VKKAALSLFIGCIWSCTVCSASGQLPNFDRRIEFAPQRAALDPQRQAAADQLRARIPAARIDLDEVLAAPKWVLNTEGFLTGPDFPDAAPPPALPGQNPLPLLVLQAAQADPYRAIRRFLDENVNLFGHGSEVLQPAPISRDFVSSHNGMRTVVWEQQLDNIRVFEAILIGHVGKNGELVALTSQFMPNLAQASGLDAIARLQLENNPAISAQEAVADAAIAIEIPLRLEHVVPMDPVPVGPEKRQSFNSVFLAHAQAELCWLPITRNNLRLCWRVMLAGAGAVEAFQVVIDAETGGAWLRQCMTESLSDASYRVFTGDSPSPMTPGWSSPNTNQPSITNRVLVVTNALSTNASPNGWIDDGENRTIGNNVDAFRGWCGNVVPTYNENPVDSGGAPLTPRAEGSPSRVFDFSLDLTQDPTNHWQAAVVQAFYSCN